MTAVIPFLTYALPAIAGVLLVLVVIELNKKWAFVVYAAVSILALLLVPDKEAATMYAAFFGFYPIIKAPIEQHLPKALQWVVKLAVFNCAVFAAYALIIFVFGIPFEDSGAFGKYSLYILLGLANVTFLMYDYALTKLITLYIKKFQKRFGKLFK